MTEERERITDLLPDLALELTLLTGEVFKADIGKFRLYGETCAILARLETWPKLRLVFEPCAIPPARDCLRTDNLKITCSPDRTALSLARDIRSRLLENARTWMTENLDYWLKAEARQQQQVEAEGILLGKGFTELTWTKGTFILEPITAKYWLDGEFTLEIRHIKPEQVAAIADLLRKEN